MTNRQVPIDRIDDRVLRSWTRSNEESAPNEPGKWWLCTPDGPVLPGPVHGASHRLADRRPAHRGPPDHPPGRVTPRAQNSPCQKCAFTTPGMARTRLVLRSGKYWPPGMPGSQHRHRHPPGGARRRGADAASGGAPGGIPHRHADGHCPPRCAGIVHPVDTGADRHAEGRRNLQPGRCGRRNHNGAESGSSPEGHCVCAGRPERGDVSRSGIRSALLAGATARLSAPRRAPVRGATSGPGHAPATAASRSRYLRARRWQPARWPSQHLPPAWTPGLADPGSS